jgi:DNA-binding winged helix-turn-helix (wHTH) protein
MDTEGSRTSANAPTRSDPLTLTTEPGDPRWPHDLWTRSFEPSMTTGYAQAPDGYRPRPAATHPSDTAHESELWCGRFRLLPQCRALLRDGQGVDLGGRAFDLMHVLMKSPGTLVSKAEIVKHVWPATFVDECNLRFQVAALRKALGEDRDLIKSIRGRGYLLAAGRPDGEARDDANEESDQAEPRACVVLKFPDRPGPSAAVGRPQALLRSVLTLLRRITQPRG